MSNAKRRYRRRRRLNARFPVCRECHLRGYHKFGCMTGRLQFRAQLRDSYVIRM